MLVYIIALFCLLMFSAFFSAAETAFTTLTPFQIEALAKEKNAAAKRAAKLAKSPQNLIGAILIGNNIANICASSIATLLAIKAWGETSVGLATGVLTLLILIFGEVTPKQFAISHNEAVAKFCSLLIGFFSLVFKPVVWFVSLFGRLANRLFGGSRRKAFALENLLHLMRLGEEQGDVDAYEKEVVTNVFRLSESTAMSVMTHRKDVFSLDSSLPLSEALPTIMKEDFTRIPVYRRNPENIVGIVLQNAVYKACIAGCGDKRLSDVMIKPLFVPASMSLSELVNVFKRESLNMAVALDEYGGLAGIVSQEDVIEEIIGEVYDENEAPQIKTQRIDKGWRLQGDTPIYWLENQLQIELDHDKHVNTIGGYLSERLGRIPEQGEAASLSEGNYRIERIENNRIVTVSFYPKSSDAELLETENDNEANA